MGLQGTVCQAGQETLMRIYDLLVEKGINWTIKDKDFGCIQLTVIRPNNTACQLNQFGLEAKKSGRRERL